MEIAQGLVRNFRTNKKLKNQITFKTKNKYK